MIKNSDSKTLIMSNNSKEEANVYSMNNISAVFENKQFS